MTVDAVAVKSPLAIRLGGRATLCAVAGKRMLNADIAAWVGTATGNQSETAAYVTSGLDGMDRMIPAPS